MTSFSGPSKICPTCGARMRLHTVPMFNRDTPYREWRCPRGHTEPFDPPKPPPSAATPGDHIL